MLGANGRATLDEPLVRVNVEDAEGVAEGGDVDLAELSDVILERALPDHVG